MRWPWQGDVDDGGPAAQGTSPRARAGSGAGGAAVAPPSPAGWAFLPALQRTIGAQDLLTRPGAFVSGLPAWSSPAFTGEMGHTMRRDAPGGMLDGDGSGLPQLTAVAPDMPLAPDDAHRTGVQRAASSATPPRRSPASDGALARVAVAPTLTSPGSEGFGVFNVPAAEPVLVDAHPSPALVSPVMDEEIASVQADVDGSIDTGVSLPVAAREPMPLPERPSGVVRSADAVTVPLGSTGAVPTPAVPAVPALPPGVALPTRRELRLPGQESGRRLGFGAPIQRRAEDPELSDPELSGLGSSGLGSSDVPGRAGSHQSDPEAFVLRPNDGDAAIGGDAASAEVSRKSASGIPDQVLPAAGGESGSASGQGSSGTVNDGPSSAAVTVLPVARMISEPGSPESQAGTGATATDISPAGGRAAAGRNTGLSSLPGAGGLPLAAATAPAVKGTPTTTDGSSAGFVAAGGGIIGRTTESSTTEPADRADAAITPLQLANAREPIGLPNPAAAEDAVVIGHGPDDAAEPDVALPLLGAPGAEGVASRSRFCELPGPGTPIPGGLGQAGPAGVVRPTPELPAQELPAQRRAASTSLGPASLQRTAIPPAAVVFPTAVSRPWTAESAAPVAAGGTATGVLVRQTAPAGPRATSERIGQSWPGADTYIPAAQLLPLQLAAGSVDSGPPVTGSATDPAVRPAELLLSAPAASVQRDAPADAAPPLEMSAPAVEGTPTNSGVPQPVQQAEKEPSNARHASAPAPAQSGQQIEELADRLYAPLVRRLKAELLLDRERRGLRTDLR